jgi:hypothetical protein
MTGMSARTTTADLQDVVVKGLLTPKGKDRSLHEERQHAG